MVTWGEVIIGEREESGGGGSPVYTTVQTTGATDKTRTFNGWFRNDVYFNNILKRNCIIITTN